MLKPVLVTVCTSGADRTIIPESQAQGLEVGETVDLHAAGHSFQGRAANVKVHVGHVTKEVRAAIVPDRIISLPLIGVDIGESEMIDALV